ncbi:MAG TPA: DUF6364 family protein [Bryobacteraceae bacterium]|nr:DUF6364 family protein [Bryobacteraceae bacterium]
MENRNITPNLPKDLLRQAKVYAAEHDTTINRMVREFLAQAVARDSRALEAMKRLLELTKQGPYFDADLREISRDEVHERR